jgi:hypothetical protein
MIALLVSLKIIFSKLVVILIALHFTGQTLQITHANHAMNTVRFVLAMKRIIDPYVRPQTICNLLPTILLVTQAVHLITQRMIQTEFVSSVTTSEKHALVMLRMSVILVVRTIFYNLLQTIQLVTQLVLITLMQIA